MSHTDASSRKLGSLIVALLAITAPPLLAQETEREVPRRETTVEAEAEKAAEASKGRAALGPSEQVTYEQVLADPDNIELNFRYARAQVARGDLKGAAATLERILLVNPKLVRVRLFYGIVLFRLDNTEESERVLREVREQTMAPSLRAEIDEYLHEIQLRRKLTRFSTSLSLGYEFDTNRNAAPAAKRRLLSDSPIALGSGTSRKRRDTSFLEIFDLTASRDLGLQGGHEVFASFDHYLQEQTAVDDLDLNSTALRAGAVIKTWLARITSSAFFEHLLLARQTFLRTPGVELEAEREFGRRVKLFANGRWGHEEYSGITENSAAPERKGDHVTTGIGASLLLTPTMRLTGSLSYDDKDAKAQYNGYQGYIGALTHTWIWPKGQFFISSFTYTFDHYNESDTAISAVRREDDQFRLRFTYGLPLLAVLGRVETLRPALKDLTATASYEQFHSNSSVVNYTYTNSKFLMMLTKTVDF